MSWRVRGAEVQDSFAAGVRGVRVDPGGVQQALDLLDDLFVLQPAEHQLGQRTLAGLLLAADGVQPVELRGGVPGEVLVAGYPFGVQVDDLLEFLLECGSSNYLARLFR